jgi:hypothetical protein
MGRSKHISRSIDVISDLIIHIENQQATAPVYMAYVANADRDFNYNAKISASDITNLTLEKLSGIFASIGFRCLTPNRLVSCLFRGRIGVFP